MLKKLVVHMKLVATVVVLFAALAAGSSCSCSSQEQDQCLTCDDALAYFSCAQPCNTGSACEVCDNSVSAFEEKA